MLREKTDFLPSAMREGVGKLIDCGSELRATSPPYTEDDYSEGMEEHLPDHLTDMRHKVSVIIAFCLFLSLCSPKFARLTRMMLATCRGSDCLLKEYLA